MSRGQIEAGLDAVARAAQASKALSGLVAGIATRYAAVLRGGGTLYFCGNGGSAADAQHMAAEYVVRYAGNRRASGGGSPHDRRLHADRGGERPRLRAGLCPPGRSPVHAAGSAGAAQHQRGERNLLAAARAGRDAGVPTVAFLGKGGGALAEPGGRSAGGSIRSDQPGAVDAPGARASHRRDRSRPSSCEDDRAPRARLRS